MSELRKSKGIYEAISKNSITDDARFLAQESIVAINETMLKITRYESTLGSRYGAQLGLRSKVLELAGLTYEGVIIQIENSIKNEGNPIVIIDNSDKERIKELVDEINELKKIQDQLNENILELATKRNEKEASKAYKQRKSNSLESRPRMSLQAAMNGYKKLVGMSFSIDEGSEGDTIYDFINEMVKNAHIEGLSGFKETVNYITNLGLNILENDIYLAILSTTPKAKEQALSEYAKRIENTRKHVKSIDKLESLVTKSIGDLLREKDAPSLQAKTDVIKLLKEIEQHVFDVPNEQLQLSWLSNIDAIRNNYDLAFLSDQTSENILGSILNHVKLLKSESLYKWQQEEEKRLDAEISLINKGRIVELLPQNEGALMVLPKSVTFKNSEGELETIPYDFGHMERVIQTKRKEIERIKNKYKKRNVITEWLRKLKATVGSSIAMVDLSAMFIQGYRATTVNLIRNPKAVFEAFTKSLNAAYDEFKKNPGVAQNIHNSIVSNAYYDLSQKVGLNISSHESHEFINEQMGEEDLFDLLHDKFKKNKLTKNSLGKVLGLRKRLKNASNAAFSTYVNLLSMSSFVDYMEGAKQQGRHVTVSEMQKIASEINNSTGRPKLGKKEEGFRYFGYVLWSPRLYYSQILNIKNIVTDPIKLGRITFNIKKEKKILSNMYNQGRKKEIFNQTEKINNLEGEYLAYRYSALNGMTMTLWMGGYKE